MKPIHVGQFSVKERAKDSYENEFEPERVTNTQAEIDRRTKKARGIKEQNALNKGKM